MGSWELCIIAKCVKSSMADSPPTIPARVTLRFLKPPGDVSKGNPSEDVHVTAPTKANVFPAHHPALCVHHPELQK